MFLKTEMQNTNPVADVETEAKSTVTPVKSSFIESIERLPNERIRVNFGDNYTQEYRNISDKKYNELIHATSVGAFYNYAIRDNAKHEINA